MQTEHGLTNSAWSWFTGQSIFSHDDVYSPKEGLDRGPSSRLLPRGSRPSHMGSGRGDDRSWPRISDRSPPPRPRGRMMKLLSCIFFQKNPHVTQPNELLASNFKVIQTKTGIRKPFDPFAELRPRSLHLSYLE